MEFEKFSKSKINTYISFIQEKEIFNNIDNLIEKHFHNRSDNSIKKKEKKILKNIKLRFGNNYFEFKENIHQNIVKELLSKLNHKDDNNIFKPLIKPKMVSLKGKFYNSEHISEYF